MEKYDIHNAEKKRTDPVRKPSLFSWQNSLGFGLSTIATLGVASIAAMMALPVSGPIGAALVLGLSGLSLSVQKSIFEKYLEEHPHKHRYSSNLHKTVRNLYEKTGLSEDRHPVYGFRIRPEEDSDSDKVKKFKSKLRETFAKMADVPNAAAFRLDKPVIIISEPLLKHLNDEEEKAVLAHEFVHARADHIRWKLPLMLTRAAANGAMSMSLLVKSFAQGWGFLGSIMAAGIVAKVSNALMNKPWERGMDKAVTFYDSDLDKRAEKVSKFLGSATFVGTMGLQSTHWLGLYAATKALSASSQVIAGSLSRMNEYHADEGAVRLGGNPLALITALRKVSLMIEDYREKHDIPDPETQGRLTRIWNGLKASHPKLDHRIRRLCKLARRAGFSEDEIREAVNRPVFLKGRDKEEIKETYRALDHL